jgi:hypothetical protein
MMDLKAVIIEALPTFNELIMTLRFVGHSSFMLVLKRSNLRSILNIKLL